MNRYALVQFPPQLNQMAQEYLKILPRFVGEDEQTIENHIAVFCNFAENLNDEHLDVFLRLFVQSLDGEARKWFKELPNNSIPTWEEMERLFIQRRGEKRDHGYSLTNFNAIKKKPDESVVEFIKRFNKLYNSLPVEIKPPPAGEKITFAGGFESDFGFTLRERRSPNLDQIQTNALEIEANLVAAGKTPETQPIQDKGKSKVESSQSQTSENMSNVIKTLSNKLIKLELESKNSQRQAQRNRNFNPQYRRQPLQILQKERKDQDQIQAPLYIEADPDEVPEHSKDHDDHISTLYAVDEDELGVKGEEYEYAETYVIYDENEIDE